MIRGPLPPTAMRRFLAALFVLDGLCAVAVALVAPAALAAPAPETVDLGGVCVEVVEQGPGGTVGRVVEADACR